MTGRKRIAAQIADIVFSISSDLPIGAIRLEEPYRDFLCTKDPEVAIHARYGGLPQIQFRDEDRLFDSGMVWSLYQIGGRSIFVLKLPAFESLPYRIAVFDVDFCAQLVANVPCYELGFAPDEGIIDFVRSIE